MPSRAPPRQPLASDPARQAIASLRGYDYQIWRSVEAWVSLKEGEALYLECAEDFYRQSPDGITATQVKYSPAPISLGNRSIRQAILNYWKLRKDNPQQLALRFQFLSRGAVTKEKGNPLGDKAGIGLWREAAKGDGPACVALAAYLSDCFKDEANIRDFLAAATPEQLRAELFGLFEWVTEEPDFELVERSINRRLVALGDKSSIAPAVAADTLDHLLERCRVTACQGDPRTRCLTREDFLLLFNQKTSFLVPQTQQVLSQFADLASGGVSNPGLPMRIARPAWRDVPPPLPDVVLRRPELVQSVQGALNSRVPTIISGTVGKGKTTLAKLAALSKPCVWVDLAGREESYLVVTLETLAIHVDGFPSDALFVLDDLEVGQELPRQAWLGLELLCREAAKKSRELLITAKGVPEDRVDGRLRMLGAKIIPVPDLELEEIQTLLASLGCPNDARLTQWARITQLHTSGHPKLVHLRGLELRDSGWPKPSTEDFAQTPPSIQSQRDLERLAVSRSLTEPDLEYLYLLSLVTLPFDRDFALRIGDIVNGLAAPGDTFDRMVGRWIDGVGDERFRVVSLLSNQAMKAWSPQRLKRAHAELFDTYMARREIDVSEALSIFIHAWLSEDGARVALITHAIIGANKQTFTLLARAMKMVLAFGKGDASGAFEHSSGASLIFRVLQFRIATREAPEEVPRIARGWLWEIQQQPPGKLRDLNELLRASSLATSTSSAIPPHEAVQCLVDIERLKALAPDIGQDPKLPDAFVHPAQVGGTVDLITTLFSFLQLRCRDIGYLSGLLEALADLNPALRARMLAAFEIPHFADTGFLVESAWVAEIRKPAPDWPRVVQVLQRAWDLASGPWSAPAMAISSAKALAIVLDEHAEDRHAAEQSIALAKSLYPEAFALDEQAANIHFRHDELTEALEGWRACLALEPRVPGRRVKDPFAFRRAGIAAARLGMHVEAADFFATGAEWAGEMQLEQTRFGLHFDAAYAAFKAGNGLLLVSQIEKGLPGIAGTPDPESAFQRYALQKLAGHVVLWILNQLRDLEANALHEPIPGCCSNPEFSTGLKSERPSPAEITTVHWIEIGDALDMPEGIYSNVAHVLAASPFPVIRNKLATLAIQSLFRRRQFDGLPALLYQLQEAFTQSVAQHRLGQPPMEPFVGSIEPVDRQARIALEHFFVGALAVQALSGRDPQTLFSRWKAEATALLDPSSTIEAVDRIESALVTPVAVAIEAMTSQSAPSWTRLAGALSALLYPTRSPQQTAYAQTGLLYWLYASDARVALEDCLVHFSCAYSSPWSLHVQTPALLRNPRLTVPALSMAIKAPAEGARKLEVLLQATELATGVNTPADLRRWLHQMADRDERRARFNQRRV